MLEKIAVYTWLLHRRRSATGSSSAGDILITLHWTLPERTGSFVTGLGELCDKHVAGTDGVCPCSELRCSAVLVGREGEMACERALSGHLAN
jgi:hypothetical protein